MNGAEAFAQGMSVGIAGVEAWLGFLNALQARQRARLAEGREITQEDVQELMDAGDAQSAAARARING